MTDDEIKSKQEETLNNLNKYNEGRKTEIVDELIEKNSETNWTEEEIEEAKLDGVDLTMVPRPPLLCQYCGSVAYPIQLHGLGYCHAKFQYEQ